MRTDTRWLLHVTSEVDDERDDAFVEIADDGIPEADEISIRPGRAAMRFVLSSCPEGRTTIWTREGLELLHEAVGQYLKAVRDREE